jgi:hypothetical protein
MRQLLAAGTIAVVLMAACTDGTTSPTPDGGAGVSPTAPPVTAPDGPLPNCLAGDAPFVANGTLPPLGEVAGDASQIAGIRWEQAAGCERIIVDLATNAGAPASSLGPTTATYDALRGVLRVALPPATTVTSISDTVIDGELAQQVYVVRTVSGGLAVDVHLRSSVPGETRTEVAAGPAAIVIDIRPAAQGGTVVVAAPTTSTDLVLLGPPPGPAEYPLQVTGYARPMADEVALVISQGGEAVAQRTRPLRRSGAWSEFTALFEGGPSGDVELTAALDRPGTSTLRIGLDMG